MWAGLLREGSSRRLPARPLTGASCPLLFFPAFTSPSPLSPGPLCSYNVGYGVLGGLTPFVVSAIIDTSPTNLLCYAPTWWLLALGGASVLGCGLIRAYEPRLNRPFVGRIE